VLLGVDASSLSAADGSPAILVARGDAHLIVDPSEGELAAFESLREAHGREATARKALVGQPTVTLDGHPVQLWANLGRPEEVGPALERGAEGVGLFRTEFLFLDRQQAPGEDEQYAAYAHVLQAMGERPVVVRTLDVGGDKPLPYLPPLVEANPFLGTRGIRFCMRHPELFRTQLRALLRAAPAGNLRIMLPMVSTPDDVAWARQELAGLRSDLAVPLGIMVETPAAAVALDLLTGGIQFCSIGSNDLTQYTLAADRGDAGLAQRYRPDDPAVFRLIGQTVESARRLGLEVGLCGELAADPAAAVALVGLGLDKLSMSPPALLEVKAALRAVTLDEARQAAARARSDSP
jgi:phosphoenolpyruvate-protein phosphotransferase